jgi:hypothetical protein
MPGILKSSKIRARCKLTDNTSEFFFEMPTSLAFKMGWDHFNISNPGPLKIYNPDYRGKTISQIYRNLISDPLTKNHRIRILYI